MKKWRKYPVWILTAAVAVLCMGLSLIHFHEDTQTEESIQLKNTYTVLCPRLSHCADAFLLYNDQEAIMIDTGEAGDADTLVALLKEKGIDSLDALILTHYDKDHIGGAPAVMAAVPVKKCYMTCGNEDSEEYHALMQTLADSDTEDIIVTETESFRALDSEFVIYPPLTASFEKNQDNNLSLIVSVKAPEDALLFAGDAQKERMEQFVDQQYDGTEYNWLKIPHHGRDKGPVKMLLEKFIPEDAVISSSGDEPENEKVVDLLEEAGVKVWLTRKKTVRFQINTADSVSNSKSRKNSVQKKIAQDSAAQDKTQEKPQVTPPEFSHQSGFYDKAFSLKLNAEKGTKIYYTLDCSEPTKESSVYTSSIKITDVTDQPNVHSMRTDMQPYSASDKSGNATQIAPGWYSRNILPGNLDKCQVVRAIAVDGDGNQSDVVTASYFVDYQNKKGYKDIAVLSLVSDPRDLFDRETGIMVNGTSYEEALRTGIIDTKTDTHVSRKYCNTFKGRGREWERKVHMDYFSDSDQSLVFSQEAGIRLHGNQSRVTQSQKSFNLYARKSYDGNSTFMTPFFENGLLQDRITLMRGNDVRNYFLSEKMNYRTMNTQDYRMVQVFLDGEYWGLYAIQDRYNSEEYLKTHYNLDVDEVVVAKGTPTGYVIRKGDPDATKISLRKVKEFAEKNDLSHEENYRQLCDMIDLQSYIDDYAVRLYVSDQDWNWFKNQYLLFYDQKWHWVVFDLDYGASWYNPAKPDTNSFLTSRLVKRYSLANDPLFPYLMKNQDFRKKFVNTYLDLGNETFNGAKMRAEIDRINEKYKAAAILEYQRYPSEESIRRAEDPTYISGFYQMCEKMATFFEARLSYASVYAAEYFGLNGTPATVTVENSDPAGGTVKVNTIIPSLDENNKWSGLYYTDFPVTLLARAKEGWVFEGWKINDNSGNGDIKKVSSQEAELTFTGDIKVKAYFHKKAGR